MVSREGDNSDKTCAQHPGRLSNGKRCHVRVTASSTSRQHQRSHQHSRLATVFLLHYIQKLLRMKEEDKISLGAFSKRPTIE